MAQSVSGILEIKLSKFERHVLGVTYDGRLAAQRITGSEPCAQFNYQ